MTNENRTWIPKGGGIYQHASTKAFYHRPTIAGCRTWRVLEASTLALAREAKVNWDKQARDHEGGFARHPDAPKGLLTMGEVLNYWANKGYPGKDGRARERMALYRAKNAVNVILPFWKHKPVASVRPALLHEFKEWRLRHSKRIKNANVIDKDRFLLWFALKLAHRDERIPKNPMTEFAPERLSNEVAAEVRHCRDSRPNDADELHDIALMLFERDGRSQVLGFQMLVEAYTGCRTSEVLRFRWDAKPGQAGYIDGDVLHLERSKKGVNPWCKMHPALRACVDALKAWRDKRFPKSPFWFPSSIDEGTTQTVDKLALTYALSRLHTTGLISHKVTSHGMRAFYVTARRSEFVPDAVIAAEIGDKTGAQIICDVYGDLPPNWLTSKVGKIDWMPKGEPAWAFFDKQTQHFWTRLARRQQWEKAAKCRKAAKAHWAGKGAANVVPLILPCARPTAEQRGPAAGAA